LDCILDTLLYQVVVFSSALGSLHRFPGFLSVIHMSLVFDLRIFFGFTFVFLYFYSFLGIVYLPGQRREVSIRACLAYIYEVSSLLGLHVSLVAHPSFVVPPPLGLYNATTGPAFFSTLAAVHQITKANKGQVRHATGGFSTRQPHC
jgi:hypothetical protein